MRAALQLRRFERDGLVPEVLAPGQFAGHADLLDRIAGINAVAGDDQSSDAETDALLLLVLWLGSRQCLLDLAAGCLDKHQIALVLDYKCLATLCKGQIDGSSRKVHLLAGRPEDLVRRDDDA